MTLVFLWHPEIFIQLWTQQGTMDILWDCWTVKEGGIIFSLNTPEIKFKSQILYLFTKKKNCFIFMAIFL